MLEAISVSKSFEGKPVLQNVNLAVSGTVAIMAPSGSGKTTLLRILLGLLAPDAGEVRTGGARVGAVFQEDRLIEHMTALQNLALVAGKASRAQLKEHLELAVRLKSRKHARSMIIVEELAAKFQIQLAAKLRDALPDVLRLQF